MHLHTVGSKEVQIGKLFMFSKQLETNISPPWDVNFCIIINQPICVYMAGDTQSCTPNLDTDYTQNY